MTPLRLQSRTLRMLYCSVIAWTAFGTAHATGAETGLTPLGGGVVPRSRGNAPVFPLRVSGPPLSRSALLFRSSLPIKSTTIISSFLPTGPVIATAKSQPKSAQAAPESARSRERILQRPEIASAKVKPLPPLRTVRPKSSH